MIIETRYSCGDKVYIADMEFGVYKVALYPYTIGQVRVTYTDSKGSGNPDEIFDNHKPQKKTEIEYMVEERGIGSGFIYKEKNIHNTYDSARDYADNENKLND